MIASKYALTIGLLGLAACGFTKDNIQSERKMSLQAKTQAANGNCSETKKEPTVTEFIEQLNCLELKMIGGFSRVNGQVAGELGNRELLALLNKVLPAAYDRLSADELSALLLVKQAFIGGQPTSVKKTEVVELFSDYKRQFLLENLYTIKDSKIKDELTKDEIQKLETAELLKLYQESKSVVERNNQLKGLKALFFKAAADKRFEKMLLHPEQLRGFFSIAKRLPLPSEAEFVVPNLSAENANILHDAFALLLGYEKQSPVPLDLVGVYALDKSLFDDGKEHAPDESDLEEPDPVLLEKVRTRIRSYLIPMKNRMAQVLGFDRGAKITQKRLASFLLSLKNTKIFGKNKRAIELNYDANDLAQKFMSAKSYAIGGSSAYIGTSDLTEIFRLLEDGLVINSFNFVTPYEKPIFARLKTLTTDTSFWSYADRRKTSFLAKNYGSTPKMFGQVDLDNLYDDFIKMKVLGGFLRAFDKNGNATLEADYGSPRNELKAMLRTFTFVDDILQTFSEQSEPGDKPDLTEAKEINGKQNSLNQLLENDVLLGSLVFYADNFNSTSNSDGALNAIEIDDLNDLVGDLLSYSKVLSMKNDEFEDYKKYVLTYYLREFANRHELDLSEINMSDESIRKFFKLSHLQYTFSDAFNALDCRQDYYVDAALALVLNFSPSQSRAKDPKTISHLKDSLEAYGPFFAIADRMGVLDEKKGAERYAVLMTWMNLSHTIAFSAHPTGVLNTEALRKLSPEERGKLTSYGSCEKDPAVMAKIKIDDVKNFFASKLNASGYSWLSGRFQLIAVAAPESLSRDFFTQLLWNAPLIQSEIAKLKANPEGFNQRKVLEILMKARDHQAANEEITQDELTRRSVLAAEALSYLLSLKL
jgi:hypothetical protein